MDDYHERMNDSMTTAINEYQTTHRLGKWPPEKKEKQKVFSTPLFISFFRDLGLSQAAFCRIHGFGVSMINDYLNGMKTPPPDRVVELARALGIEVDDVMVEVDYE